METNPKIVEFMRQFAESYAKSTDTFFCSDLDVTESVIQGLSKIRKTYAHIHVVIMMTKKMKLSSIFELLMCSNAREKRMPLHVVFTADSEFLQKTIFLKTIKFKYNLR